MVQPNEPNVSTRIMLVVPDKPNGTPAVTTNWSPVAAIFCWVMTWLAISTISSVLVASLLSTGLMPQDTVSCWQDLIDGEMAITSVCMRLRATLSAVAPELEKQHITSADKVVAM